MKKLIIFILFLNIYAFDLSKQSIVYLFKNHYFNFICQHRWQYINKYLGKREDLLSIVGYSCLKEHHITLALDVAKALRFTKTGRINANYIATLFNIKTLLIRYVYNDKISLKLINNSYILDDDLGKVFYFAKIQKPIVKNNTFSVYTKTGEKIKVFYDVKSNIFILSFYKNSKLIKKDEYW